MLVSPAVPDVPQGIFDQALARTRTQSLDLGALFAAAEQLKELQRFDLVIDLYKHWIAYNGNNPLSYAACFNYGATLSERSDISGAVNAFRDAIRLKADFWPPYINLGGQLEKLGLTGEAVTVWTTLIDSFPTLTGENIDFKTTSLKQVGRVLEVAQNDSAAENILQQSLEIDPHQDDVAQHWFALRQKQCKWPVLQEWGRVKIRSLRAAISPLSMACYTDDPMLQLATGYRYNKTSVAVPAQPRAFRHEVTPGTRRPGRLRIGYVSSDLRQHAVGFSMTDVMETHDREAVEVFAYYCGISSPDSTQDRIKAAVEHWHDLTGMSDQQAAALIKGHAIDILVDLNGYTKDARTAVFALRPAPIIVNWFGFPATMGSPYHHYLIADDIIIPKEAEKYYSEKVLRLPCYQPNDRKRVVAPERPTRQSAGLPETGFVFCSLNGMQKINEATFTRWMTILQNVPDSVLWLLTGSDETNARLRAVAERNGVAGERLIFAEKAANPQHVARYVLANLFLDTFPYGSHTTAADALWMGVPILTRIGRSFASRVCASLVTAAGLSDLVCATADEYVQRAIACGRDKSLIASYRRRLAEVRTSLLFDTPRLVSHLEGLYRQMARDFEDGCLPVPDLDNLEIYHEVGIAADLPAMEAVDDAAYEALYRGQLAARHDMWPVRRDARLWTHPA
ncbi:O-linked N-acetylglucosamine transferase, SPINDLY family protein [Lichenifustis flavocetrariae]|uniref:Glycosyl transferase n=1 Tax=Lichenifustis flavocetrariae TaxID=2949735 RepID=A0AA42CP33_9HYPH|nr:glycosyl transferase [Lichenifustis flavocetrariae]MCW6510022.1 glycosyl transferase [Lichenifustis flavocetrariae]